MQPVMLGASLLFRVRVSGTRPEGPKPETKRAESGAERGAASPSPPAREPGAL